MSTDLSEIPRDALSLPDEDRARLAQQLWESLTEAGHAASPARQAETAEIAAHRDTELTTGAVQPQTHDEAMRAAREAIQSMRQQLQVGFNQADRGQLVDWDPEHIKAEGRRRLAQQSKA